MLASVHTTPRDCVCALVLPWVLGLARKRTFVEAWRVSATSGRSDCKEKKNQEKVAAVGIFQLTAQQQLVGKL